MLLVGLVAGIRLAPPGLADRIGNAVAAHLPGISRPTAPLRVKVRRVALRRGSSGVLRSAHGITVAASSTALWTATDPDTGYTARVLTRLDGQWQQMPLITSAGTPAGAATYPITDGGRYRVELVDRTGTIRERWTFRNKPVKATAHDSPGRYSLYYSGGRTPDRWCDRSEYLTDPGHRIRYYIDYFGTDQIGITRKQARGLVADAFSQWSRASGKRYQFAYGGPADLPPTPEGEMTWDAIPTGAIGVSFVGGAESGWGQYATPRLETTGLQSVVGLGGAATTSAPGDAIRTGVITSGAVLIDAHHVGEQYEQALTSWRRYNRVSALGNIVRHELGHALGLQHTPTGIMAPTTNDQAPTGIDPGAQAGIRRLASLPCLATGP